MWSAFALSAGVQICLGRGGYWIWYMISSMTLSDGLCDSVAPYVFYFEKYDNLIQCWQWSTAAKDDPMHGTVGTPFQEPHPRSIMIGRATYIVQDTTCSMLILLLLCVTVPSHHAHGPKCASIHPSTTSLPTRRFWQFRCFVLYIVHCTNIFCSVICASHMKSGSASCISEVHTDERNTYSQPPDSRAGWQANEEDCFRFL